MSDPQIDRNTDAINDLRLEVRALLVKQQIREKRSDHIQWIVWSIFIVIIGGYALHRIVGG